MSAFTAPRYSLAQKALAECLGTAILLCAVIGSGIMAQRLSAGNSAVALLANTVATVLALYVLIEVLGPVSGAHFNPLVTIIFMQNSGFDQQKRAQAAIIFIAFQLLGAVLGAWLANAMFDLPLLHTSTTVRGGSGQWLAEAVATAGLIFVIARCAEPVASSAPMRASALVASYIGAAYWFTSSTSFANPAAVMGRMLSDSFAGIAPHSAPGFVVAQCAGAALGYAAHQMLATRSRN